mmetsp:Transcript_594/g.1614  ORF Transcript_594/g.1614 Transcript_594/m.1614 type:complete len:210 (-) Transcript_594:929-1558(-)
MTRTPISSGNASSSAALMAAATPAPRSTRPPPSKWPLKPPPMSSSSMWWPMSSAQSNTARAAAMADKKVVGSRAPLPTWNDTPATRSPRSLAALSRAGASPGSAPYLSPSLTRADGSSARMRSTQRNSGLPAAIFSSSLTVSNVVYSMCCSAAYAMSEGRLQGCAKMMRERGAPSDSTAASSALDAQSKPAPSASSSLSSAGSGLHLTA